MVDVTGIELDRDWIGGVTGIELDRDCGLMVGVLVLTWIMTIWSCDWY